VKENNGCKIVVPLYGKGVHPIVKKVLKLEREDFKLIYHFTIAKQRLGEAQLRDKTD